MATRERLKTYRDWCDARLNQQLPTLDEEPRALHEAMRYSALAPGKRLRPQVLLAAAEAVGGVPEAVLDAACAVELVHCFSLIHDDLPAIDNDDLRRGMPTCHVRFGEGLALLAGDALFALAFELLGQVNAAPERVVASLVDLAEASGPRGLVGGEVVDILTEGRPYDAAILETIHARKTGALIAASAAIGARLGGGSNAQIESLRAFGQAVGLAFQVVDDILNETSTPEQLGKAAGSDRARQKATYPALFGIEASRRRARDLVDQAILSLRCADIESNALTALATFAIDRPN